MFNSNTIVNVRKIIIVELIMRYLLFIFFTNASFTFGLRCVYGARRLPVNSLQISYGFTGSVASTILY